VGHTLRVTVKATNSVGSAVATSLPTAVVTAKPRNTSPPTIAGVAKQGETLTANPGTWSGTQPMTFSYQWRRCDSSGGSCADIIGASGKTYTLASVDVGNTVRVGVTATNKAGASFALSAPTAVVSPKVAPVTDVTMDASRELVVYGRKVTLSGSVT